MFLLYWKPVFDSDKRYQVVNDGFNLKAFFWGWVWCVFNGCYFLFTCWLLIESILLYGFIEYSNAFIYVLFIVVIVESITVSMHSGCLMSIKLKNNGYYFLNESKSKLEILDLIKEHKNNSRFSIF
jgi:hypothetical protein